MRACECEWARAVECASENALRRAPRAVQRPSLVPTLLRAVSVASLCACPAASAVAMAVAAAVCRWTQPSARHQRDSVPHLTPLKSHVSCCAPQRCCARVHVLVCERICPSFGASAITTQSAPVQQLCQKCVRLPVQHKDRVIYGPKTAGRVALACFDGI